MTARKSGKKLALSAVVGGLAGYITGILTAPKSGKATRDEISLKAEAVKDETEAKLQQANDELNETINDAKSKTLALSAKARAEYDEAVVKAKDALNKGTQVLKAVKAGEAPDPDLNRAIKQARQASKNLGKYLKG